MAARTPYLERYVAGEYERVWDELVALGAGCTQAYSVTVPDGSHGIHDVMSALAEVLAAPRYDVSGPTASPFYLV